MSKLKQFVATCVVILSATALIAGVCASSAQAGRVVFVTDEHPGWESRWDGNSNPERVVGEGGRCRRNADKTLTHY